MCFYATTQKGSENMDMRSNRWCGESDATVLWLPASPSLLSHQEPGNSTCGKLYTLLCKSLRRLEAWEWKQKNRFKLCLQMLRIQQLTDLTRHFLLQENRILSISPPTLETEYWKVLFFFFFLQQFLSLRSTDICVHDTQWISQLASRWPIMNHREHTCKITHTCTHSHACRYQSLFLLSNTWHTRTWGRPHMMKFSKTNMLKLTDKRK